MSLFKGEVVMPSGRMLIKLIIGSFVVGVLASTIVPRILRLDRESKLEDARFTVVRLAAGYCGANHGTCDHVDPWGNPYRFYWGRDVVVVQSFGEDGLAFTADDIWSNR